MPSFRQAPVSGLAMRPPAQAQPDGGRHPRKLEFCRRLGVTVPSLRGEPVRERLRADVADGGVGAERADSPPERLAAGTKRAHLLGPAERREANLGRRARVTGASQGTFLTWSMLHRTVPPQGRNR